MTQQLVTSTLLITAVLLLRKLLWGRISRRMQYALWVLVALRLLIPFSIPSSASVMNAVDSPRTQQLIQQSIIRVNPQWVQTEPEEIPHVPALSGEEAQKPRISLVAAVWITGSAVTAGGMATVNWHFWQKLKRNRKPFAVPGSRLPVYTVEGIPSPCLFGLFHPAIYLTPQSAADSQRLRHVLAHETCHYRQGDHLWSLVRVICLIGYWFHPLVWAAAACSRTDCELACDAFAVQVLGEKEKFAYSKTLVDLVRQRQRVSQIAYAATTMASGKSTMKERIQMIVKSPKTTLSGLALLLACVIALVSCTFTGKETSSNPPSQGEELLAQEGYQWVSVTFPAYQTGRTESNQSMYETKPFDVVLELPENWNVFLPETDQREEKYGMWTPVIIQDENGQIATIQFNSYQPGDTGLSQEERYKEVYANLRLSSLVQMDGYTPVRTGETQETALAQITYATNLEEYPGAAAQAPRVQVPAVLGYDTGLGVYAGIVLEPGASVPEETLQIIAQSMQLKPSEYGLSGKRFGGEYSQDYSHIKILDAQQEDVSKIMVDLWYCASDAYDVDGMTVFENGDWVTLSENRPQYIELKNYSQVMPTIFTQKAIAQYEKSSVVDIQKTADGKVYRLGPWRTGYSYAWALTNLKAQEVSEDRIVLEATYIKNPGYAGAGEDPNYTPEYGTVPFIVVKEQGVWLVDEYVYPESQQG